MRHRVRLESQSSTQSSSGEPANVWTLVATRWMAIRPLSGNEQFVWQQRGARVSHRFGMRWMSGLEPRMRLVWDSRVFDVQWVDQDPKKASAVLYADELVGEAP